MVSFFSKFISYSLIFMAGAVLGSFFNLIIERIPQKKDIIFLRSHCVFCHTLLRPSDLIPIFSYLRCKGTCRYCKKKYGKRHLYIELLAGTLALYIFQKIFNFD